MSPVSRNERLAIADAQGERIVIFRPRLRRRSRAVETESQRARRRIRSPARSPWENLDAVRTARPRTWVQPRSVASHRSTARPDEFLDDGGQAARVVVMRVGQHHYVELANGARPEIRRYDVFADIEPRLPASAEDSSPPPLINISFESGKETSRLSPWPHRSRSTRVGPRAQRAGTDAKHQGKQSQYGGRPRSRPASARPAHRPGQQQQPAKVSRQRQPQGRIGYAPGRLKAQVPIRDLPLRIQKATLPAPRENASP